MQKADPVLRNRMAERRQHKRKTEFPLTDSTGVRVLDDRRIQPDRRLGNIEAECVSIDHCESGWK
jgi:uncharacterized protein (DUF111 family)